jgi:DNA-binding protein HU-beta
VNRRELVNAVAAQTDYPPREVDTILKAFTDVVTAVAAKGEPVAISGFAKFVRREYPARMGRNPATGETIQIKASKKARITPLKSFKDSVMNPSTAPKLRAGVWPPRPATAKKATPNKATAKKTTTAKKAAPKKATAKKAPAKKAPAKKKATAKKATAKKTTRRR